MNKLHWVLVAVLVALAVYFVYAQGQKTQAQNQLSNILSTPS